ncbi:MAG: PGPGW domain-containing protein [Actinobacteria bacterium]|nr:PGPGW domain-containing protein [Actinomycetota bacterium]
MEEAPRKRRLLDGVRERREKHLERSRIVRVVVAIFGFLVVLAGLAMLVLPGPGLLVIAIGLGILALEFVWAERLLERTVDKMDDAADAVKGSSRTQRALGTGLMVLAVAGAVAAAIRWDIPLLPV